MYKNQDVQVYDNPVKFNEMFQAQRRYGGLDTLQEQILAKGEMIVAVEVGPPRDGGNYFMTLQDFKRYDLDAAKICQSVQVAPWQNPNESINPEYMAEYKPVARLYYVAEEMKVAYGDTTMNPQYGKGGEKQIVIEQGYALTNDGLRSQLENSPLQPIDLNQYHTTPNLPDYVKEQLKEIEGLYGKNRTELGTLELKNRLTSEGIYRLFTQRNTIHETQIKLNCALKEYVDEKRQLQPNEKYLEELENEIRMMKDKKDERITGMLKSVEKLNLTEDLIVKLSVEEKDFLFDTDTCIPHTTMKMTQYLEAQKEQLERGIYEPNAIVHHQSNDEQVQAFYDHITKEAYAVEVNHNLRRDLIYTPYVEQDRSELLICYQAREQLDEMIQNKVLGNKQEGFEKGFNMLQRKISDLEQKVTTANRKSNTVNNKLNYMTEKYKHQKEGKLAHFVSDVQIESKIGHFCKKNMDRMPIATQEVCKMIHTVYESKVEALQAQKTQVRYVDSNRHVEEKSKPLTKGHTMEQYRAMAKQANQKDESIQSGLDDIKPLKSRSGSKDRGEK